MIIYISFFFFGFNWWFGLHNAQNGYIEWLWFVKKIIINVVYDQIREPLELIFRLILSFVACTFHNFLTSSHYRHHPIGHIDASKNYFDCIIWLHFSKFIGRFLPQLTIYWGKITLWLLDDYKWITVDTLHWYFLFYFLNGLYIYFL